MADRQYKTTHLAPYQFKPGQSGCPGGNKGKYKLNLTAIMREVLESHELCGQSVPNGRTVAQALVESALAHAIKRGDAALIREVMQRIDGNAPDHEYASLSDDELIARAAGALDRDGTPGAAVPGLDEAPELP